VAVELADPRIPRLAAVVPFGIVRGLFAPAVDFAQLLEVLESERLELIGDRCEPRFGVLAAVREPVEFAKLLAERDACSFSAAARSGSVAPGISVSETPRSA
jgi:hypothetical protein